MLPGQRPGGDAGGGAGATAYPAGANPDAVPAAPAAQPPAQAQGQVQKAFQTQVDWGGALDAFFGHATTQEQYGELLGAMTPGERKVLEVRMLAPLVKAAYARKPGALPAKRAGVLGGYKSFAEKKGIQWASEAAALEGRGSAFWEALRAHVKRDVRLPEYYRACYEGPIHSYNSGNGEWSAAFDAPSAYLLVHLHHFPDMSPQEAFDALHEELDTLALKRLPDGASAVRCVDIGCGVGTSTFSTARSLGRLNLAGRVTGVDLSDYFVAVAEHLAEARASEFGHGVSVGFLHGDGLDLKSCGFADSSADMVTVSEVTHEMPTVISEALFAEVARVLVPGGVLAFMDLNPAQILKENSVGNLADRIAASNEPYFAEYLALDAVAAMRAAGLDVVEETWPHRAKYPTLESCSLRIIIAKKPVATTLETWTGRWALDRRENWSPYLTCLGVPEAAHEAAAKAPDFHQYEVTESSFFMDHQIPGKGMHLRFTGFFGGDFLVSPYPRPTGTLFGGGDGEKAEPPQWKHTWVDYPKAWRTTMPDLAGPGKTVTLDRELAGPNEIRYTVHVRDEASGEQLVGPCYTYMRRTSSEPPADVARELRERFATGVSRSLAWRQDALDRAGAMILENVPAISAAQAEDHVSPSDFFGASMMMRGAVAFYKACLPGWAAPRSAEETAPPPMRTEGAWEVVPEPKGVGLIIAPWNAPVILSVLPLLAMLAAGNLCVIKPSEAAPATSLLLARLVQRYFADRSVVVAEGGPKVVERLIASPVDHILFTGGGEVARRILALAAPHLTPVSLELGGKSPCFVDRSSAEELETYAAEIVGTKSYFGGQFCQAHDYCLVHAEVFDAFVERLVARIEALGERRKCRMINAAHAARVRGLLAGHEAIARPALPAAPAMEDDCVLVTLLLAPDPASPVMRQEIFGPLLPVLRVGSAEEAAAFVAQRPKPLVAYCYSQDKDAWAAFRDATSSGNLAVNCGPQRMQSNFNVGIGGVGASGFGYSIWGRAAFDDYSNQKAVFSGTKFAGSTWGAAPPPPRPAA